MAFLGCFGLLILIIILVTAFQASVAQGFIVLFIIGVILWAIYYSAHKQKQAEEEMRRRTESKLLSKQKSVSDYKVTQQFISSDSKYILSYDEIAKKINFASENENKAYPFSDILQSEIIQDGLSVTTTSRGSQIGGALIGGVLLGGAGAVIGGLSGDKKTKERIKKIQLKIVVNDTISPNYYVLFLDNEIELDNDDPIVKDAKDKINYWNDIMSVLIKRADEEDRKREKEIIGEKSNGSVADELLKLSNLLQQGIITQDEFDSQKKKILSI